MSTTTLQIFKNRLTMEPGKDLKNVMELMPWLLSVHPIQKDGSITTNLLFCTLEHWANETIGPF